MILSLIVIGPNNKLYGNSISFDTMEEEVRYHLEKDAENYAKPEWPRVFIKSDGPICPSL